MNRAVTSLLLVLIIQCGLVATVYWPNTTEDPSATQPMLPVERASISEILVGDEFDNETTLLKVGERWSLPELENLPADTDMVERLLDAITADRDSWPVADSVAALGDRERRRLMPASFGC